MDKIDKRLLYELNWDCRQTENELGKKLRISKQVVNYRIKKLEKEKILTGYNALIDWRRLGYSALRIYIKWRNISPELEEEIYNYIRESPLFMWTVKFEGDFDCGLYVWSKGIVDFSRKWNKFFEKYKKYILRQEYYESINMINYQMKFLVDKKTSEEKIIGNKEPVVFDEKDYGILKIISFNAKIPIVDLAGKIKLTPKAVIYRLRNLEKKGIILGYNAIINFEKIGYKFYKVDFYLNDLSKIKEMYDFARQHKQIGYVMRTFGGPDYEVEIYVQEEHELKEIIDEIRSKFYGVIESYRFHYVSETIKQVYLPGQVIEEGEVIKEPGSYFEELEKSEKSEDEELETDFLE